MMQCLSVECSAAINSDCSLSFKFEAKLARHLEVVLLCTGRLLNQFLLMEEISRRLEKTLWKLDFAEEAEFSNNAMCQGTPQKISSSSREVDVDHLAELLMVQVMFASVWPIGLPRLS